MWQVEKFQLNPHSVEFHLLYVPTVQKIGRDTDISADLS
jgi:hypothetical protein